MRNANDVGRYKHLHALNDAPRLDFANGVTHTDTDGSGGVTHTDTDGSGSSCSADVPAAAAADPQAATSGALPEKKKGSDAGILSFFGI